MSDAYIEQYNGAYIVAGSRVFLDSIVYAFLSGQSAEAIAQAFPHRPEPRAMVALSQFRNTALVFAEHNVEQNTVGLAPIDTVVSALCLSRVV